MKLTPLLLMGLSLALVACGSRSPAQGAKGGASVSTESPPSLKRTPAIPMRPADRPPEPKPAPPQPMPPIAQALAFSLAAPVGPIIPVDAAIGPLQDGFPLREDERIAVRTAVSFLDAVISERHDESLFYPDIKDRLMAVLIAFPPWPAGEPRPSRYRLGALRFGEEGDAAIARVVFLEAKDRPRGGQSDAAQRPHANGGAKGRREGELALRRDRGGWYIDSFVLDGDR